MPPGQLIFNTDWDDFPRLFYFDPSHYYVSGLDPSYLFDKNPDLSRLYERITLGTEEDPGPLIRDRFGARYVFSDNTHHDFFEHARSSGWFDIVYEDTQCTIMYIRDEKIDEEMLGGLRLKLILTSLHLFYCFAALRRIVGRAASNNSSSASAHRQVHPNLAAQQFRRRSPIRSQRAIHLYLGLLTQRRQAAGAGRQRFPAGQRATGCRLGDNRRRKKVIGGTNFNLEEGNLEALKKRTSLKTIQISKPQITDC